MDVRTHGGEVKSVTKIIENLKQYIKSSADFKTSSTKVKANIGLSVLTSLYVNKVKANYDFMPTF